MVADTSSNTQDDEAPVDQPARRVNPLTAAAEPLILALGPLSQPQTLDSLGPLQQHLLDALDDFNIDAAAQGIPEAQLDHACYALCALLDETILASTWGAKGWADYSLLTARYNEGFGGETFFERVQQAGTLRGDGVALLEFFHLCMSLGYSGRFHPRRHTSNGIEYLRQQIASLVRQFRQPLPLLSPAADGLAHQPRGLPIWVLASIVGALLLGVYHGLDRTLSHSADQALGELQSISRER